MAFPLLRKFPGAPNESQMPCRKDAIPSGSWIAARLSWSRFDFWWTTLQTHGQLRRRQHRTFFLSRSSGTTSQVFSDWASPPRESDLIPLSPSLGLSGSAGEERDFRNPGLPADDPLSFIRRGLGDGSGD